MVLFANLSPWTQYLKYVKLIEEQTSKVFYNKLTYIFLEPRKGSIRPIKQASF